MRRLTTLFALALVATVCSVWASPGSPVTAAAGYQPLDAPQRLLDTRGGQPTADGQYSGVGAIAGGTTLVLPVAGRAGIPNDPGSVVLNVTATGSLANGFIVGYPCDQQRPPTANLNYAPAQTIANTVIIRVTAAGTVCFYARSTVHLVVDAGGVLPSDSFDPLAAPERLADTRPGQTTVDGAFAGAGRRAAGSTYTIDIAGRGSIPGNATAVVLNVTATGPFDRGFLTIFPCDRSRPLAANLTYSPGQTIPNAVMTRLDGNGRICIFTRAATDLVVDATGVLPGDVFKPLPAPQRIADTRPTEDTADGQFERGGQQPAGGTLQLDVAGRVGIPAGARSVVLNVTSTGSTGRGFVTAHPQGSDLPTAANLNHPSGVNVSNLVVAGLGPAGDVCLFTKSNTDLVVDVIGWMEGTAPSTSSSACPGRTTDVDANALRDVYLRRPLLHNAVGTDRIAVFICQVPPNSTAFASTDRHSITPGAAADYLDDVVSPWYTNASFGLYSVQFDGVGTIAMSSTDGPSQCQQRAAASAGAPYTGAFGIDNTETGGGFAGPGGIFSDPRFDRTIFAVPASQSRRSGWLGGGNISSRPNPGAFVHELGHMLHWPHSFIGPGLEYDNWVDVMSRGQGWCDVPGSPGSQYNCDPAHTIAFNRFAAGWLGVGDVIVHDRGTVNYLLDKPASSGIQMVALPDAGEPNSMLTLEARPAVGDDDFFEREGVALHVADQVARTSSFTSGISTNRRHRQAMGAPSTYEHVLAVGEQATVHGVTVKVLQRVGDRFMVQVSGSYQMPAPAFFAERFARDSCASIDLDAALAAGCTL